MERPSSAPMPSTPVGKQGAIPITTRVQPPTVGTRIAEDSIVYPHHLVFAVIPRHTSVNSWKSGMPLTPAQSRTGDTTPSIANFRIFKDPATKQQILNDYIIRFLGVSYEGCPDYKTAEKNSDINGRFSVSISGKATVFCDTRTLAGARIGDIIYAEAQPANFIWQDGHRNFHPPRLTSGPPNGALNPADFAVHSFIGGDNFGAREYAMAFGGDSVTVEEKEYELVKTGIRSFDGHPLTKELKDDKTVPSLTVLELFCSVEKEKLANFVESVPDNQLIAAYYLSTGNLSRFETSGGESGAAPATLSREEHAAFHNMVQQITGDTMVKTSMTQKDLRALSEEILATSRGYPFVGLVYAQKGIKNIRAVLIPEEEEGLYEHEIEGSETTATSFTNRLRAIQTAASTSSSLEESSSSSRPTKRARSVASRVTNPARFPIGTLVENGSLSGRNNEISILIDPRLGL